jgi:F-type H+-transporting ATPase subunit gamma
VEQLPRLRARISSLQKLRDLIRAMRALAASRVQEAHGALAGIRQYVEVVEDAIAEGAGLLPQGDGRALGIPSSAASVLIVVCSEHGFTGALNEELLDRAESELKRGQGLGIVGQRGAILAAERSLKVAWSFPMATHVGGILGVTRRVTDHLAGASAAEIVFGNYRRGGYFTIECIGILPLDPALLVGSERLNRPLHHLDPDNLLQRLADEYLFAEITRAITESLASENGARLRVMEAADHNIGDKLEVFRRREHSLRQESITSELLDVVTGVEAILGQPR